MSTSPTNRADLTSPTGPSQPFVPTPSPAQIDHEIQQAQAQGTRPPTSSSSTPERYSFELFEYSQHKHSVRYNTSDASVPVDNAYVKRSAWTRMPRGVHVTIEPIW